MTALSWYALYCAHKAEFRVEEAFREGELVRLGCDVYCPTETKWHRERRIRRIVRWPLLPGYVFAGLAPDQHGDLPFPMVRAIEGVVKFIGFGETPARLPYDAPLTDTPNRPLTIGEIRAMEEAGEFDFTQDRIVAEKAAKLVRRSYKGFRDLAAALSEMSEEAA